MAKYNISQSGNLLKIELVPNGGDASPRISYASSFDWCMDRIKFFLNGQYTQTLRLPEFGEIGGVEPTTIQDAAEKIDAIVATFNSGGSVVIADLISTDSPNNLELGTDGKLLVPNNIKTQASISASNIDWDAANFHYKTLSANTTFTFSNAGNAKETEVFITNTASNYIVTWPAGIDWGLSGAPTQRTGAVTDAYRFVQVNGVIYGFVRQ